MSGFPGPEGYAEYLQRQRREDKEQARSEADYQPPERSPDLIDPVEQLRARARNCSDFRDAIVMQTAADYIVTLIDLIDEQAKLISSIKETSHEQQIERRDG